MHHDAESHKSVREFETYGSGALWQELEITRRIKYKNLKKVTRKSRDNKRYRELRNWDTTAKTNQTNKPKSWTTAKMNKTNKEPRYFFIVWTAENIGTKTQSI